MWRWNKTNPDLCRVFCTHWVQGTQHFKTNAYHSHTQTQTHTDTHTHTHHTHTDAHTDAHTYTTHIHTTHTHTTHTHTHHTHTPHTHTHTHTTHTHTHHTHTPHTTHTHTHTHPPKSRDRHTLDQHRVHTAAKPQHWSIPAQDAVLCQGSFITCTTGPEWGSAGRGQIISQTPLGARRAMSNTRQTSCNVIQGLASTSLRWLQTRSWEGMVGYCTRKKKLVRNLYVRETQLCVGQWTQ